jgi:phosphate starvation-inducible PhoH-like protein
MKTFLFSSTFLLLSSFGLNRGFYRPIGSMARTYGINRDIFQKNMEPALSLNRRKNSDITEFDSEHDNKQKRKIKSFQPKTENQKAFVELMRMDDVDIIIAIGPAGTGKTMLACCAAVESLRLGKVNKIVITRPVVSVGEEIGFLPGSIESKMDPWTRPIFDVLRETYSAKDITHMTEEGVIEIVPLGFMRGRTFKNTWIIADEMQNSSPNQMFMLATRIGEGSKMIITGDLNQSDLDSNNNGLLQINNKVRNAEMSGTLDCVRYIELDKDDVQRSRAAKTILNIYDMPVYHKIPDEVQPKQSNTKLHIYTSQYYDDDHYSANYSNEFDYMNQVIRDSELDDISTLSEQTPNERAQYFTFLDTITSTTASTPTSTPTSSINEQISPTSSEWVDIDNDAALIPLKHIKKLPPQWK